MISTTTFYTIQSDITHSAELSDVETLITKGLYRFTILGMNPRHSSDTKDRVYAALRSSGLLNLKSDNRKIIVNISPDETIKKEGYYDLAIALSCISCTDKHMPETRILAVGGLSISGKITPSKRLFQAIYAAYKNNIPLVVCGYEDILSLKETTIQKLQEYGIHIISAETLKDIVESIKYKVDIPQDRNRGKDKDQKKSTTSKQSLQTSNTADKEPTLGLDQLDFITRAILIALCGGHHILIETTLTKSIKKICTEMCSYVPKKHFGKDIFRAHQDKTLDNEHSLGVTYIENIKNYTQKQVLSNKSPHKDSIVATYAPCSCGYQYSFFESNQQDKKCICSQRSLLQYKRHTESVYFDIFDIKITNTEESLLSTYIDTDKLKAFYKTVDKVRDIQFNRYVLENMLTEQEFFFFPDNSYLNTYKEIIKPSSLLDDEAKKLWLEHKGNETTLRVAQTIQDILNIEANTYIETKKCTVSKRALILAISYIPRMDF